MNEEVHATAADADVVQNRGIYTVTHSPVTVSMMRQAASSKLRSAGLALSTRVSNRKELWVLERKLIRATEAMPSRAHIFVAVVEEEVVVAIWLVRLGYPYLGRHSRWDYCW